MSWITPSRGLLSGQMKGHTTMSVKCQGQWKRPRLKLLVCDLDIILQITDVHVFNKYLLLLRMDQTSIPWYVEENAKVGTIQRQGVSRA